jgi:hypothetical protein
MAYNSLSEDAPVEGKLSKHACVIRFRDKAGIAACCIQKEKQGKKEQAKPDVLVICEWQSLVG